jgi:hypothetical protein
METNLLKSRRSTAAWLAQIAAGVFFLFVGIAFSIAGSMAIQKSRLELGWRSRGGLSIGPIGVIVNQTEGASVYQGADAVRMGIGFVSSGAVFGAWGLCILGSLVLRWPAGIARRLGRRILGSLSFCGLAVASFSFFPPWQPESLPFFLVVTVFSVFAFAVGGAARNRWGPRLGIAMVASAIAGSYLGPEIFVAICLGFFAFVGGFINLALVIPAIGRRIERSAATSS